MTNSRPSRTGLRFKSLRCGSVSASIHMCIKNKNEFKKQSSKLVLVLWSLGLPKDQGHHPCLMGLLHNV